MAGTQWDAGVRNSERKNLLDVLFVEEVLKYGFDLEHIDVALSR